MFTDDVKRLQQSTILKEYDVVQLSNDIIETVCIAEGLFPSSLITAEMHQLIHHQWECLSLLENEPLVLYSIVLLENEPLVLYSLTSLFLLVP